VRLFELSRLGTPTNWSRKESFTFLSPDGQVNVIASIELLHWSLDSRTYAQTQGELLRREFPQYLEYAFYACSIMGAPDGYRREFTWLPPNDTFVHQVQLYQVVEGRGFTATATARFAEHLESPEVVELLRQLHDGPV
jgi:hypothetical protein